MQGNDRAIISWAWKGQGKIGGGGQNQEGKQEKETYKCCQRGYQSVMTPGPL